MTHMPPLKKLRTVEPLPAPDSIGIGPLDAIHLLRSSGKALFAQIVLHGQLIQVEWAEEKSRLLKMLIVALLGFAGVLCVMLFVGVAALTLSWETAYRIPTAVALVVVYASGAAIAWRRLQALSALSDQAFAATREELAADLALLKSKL